LLRALWSLYLITNSSYGKTGAAGERPRVAASLGAGFPFPKRPANPAEFASLALEMLTNSYFNGETVRLDGAIRMAPK
jgi:hypothetical protein